jgi:mRNA interferase RelE/StbE
LTTYRLTFLRDAKKEWDKLNSPIREQFERKLRQILETPRRPAARLSGMRDCYKIKLKDAGYRLVYRVFDDRIVVQVVAIGRRERNAVYIAAAGRLDS